MADKQKKNLGRNMKNDTKLIAGFKKREKKLRAKLKEKDTLIKEIHHRVRNNIQIISSLIRLQASTIQDEKLAEVLRSTQGRIRSISLIHEKLSQSRDFAMIDFGEYIRALGGQLFHLAGANPSAIRLEVKAKQVKLDAKKAISCGLIINELVLNALKYAFPPGKTGNIRIEMKRQAGGRYLLIASDDGVGLPKNIDLQKPERLGFQIVRDLVKQLDGNLKIVRKAGTAFRITF
jgi:two-component sensor histidine kinase